ncbi:MAG TPA: hypothetical protein VM369_07640 [Candidatus Binatia bacterium]|nr:hypothetical protein [Candidatus Binatia bacterium]
MALRHAWAATALLLAACGDPAVSCGRDIDEMKAKLVGVVGGAHKDSGDPLVQAHTHLDMAQTALATGNIRTCVENVDAAKDLLKQAAK